MWKHFQQGKVQELFDRNLMLDNYHVHEMMNSMLRVVHVGLLCTQKLPALRPSMSTALQMLSRKDEHLPSPTPPPYIDGGDSPERGGGGDSEASNAGISYTTFYPR